MYGSKLEGHDEFAVYVAWHSVGECLDAPKGMVYLPCRGCKDVMRVKQFRRRRILCGACRAEHRKLSVLLP